MAPKLRHTPSLRKLSSHSDDGHVTASGDLGLLERTSLSGGSEGRVTRDGFLRKGALQGSTVCFGGVNYLTLTAEPWSKNGRKDPCCAAGIQGAILAVHNRLRRGARVYEWSRASLVSAAPFPCQAAVKVKRVATLTPLATLNRGEVRDQRPERIEFKHQGLAQRTEVLLESLGNPHTQDGLNPDVTEPCLFVEALDRKTGLRLDRV